METKLVYFSNIIALIATKFGMAVRPTAFNCVHVKYFCDYEVGSSLIFLFFSEISYGVWSCMQ